MISLDRKSQLPVSVIASRHCSIRESGNSQCPHRFGFSFGSFISGDFRLGNLCQGSVWVKDVAAIAKHRNQWSTCFLHVQEHGMFGLRSRIDGAAAGKYGRCLVDFAEIPSQAQTHYHRCMYDSLAHMEEQMRRNVRSSIFVLLFHRCEGYGIGRRFDLS